MLCRSIPLRKMCNIHANERLQQTFSKTKFVKEIYEVQVLDF